MPQYVTLPLPLLLTPLTMYTTHYMPPSDLSPEAQDLISSLLKKVRPLPPIRSLDCGMTSFPVHSIRPKD